MGGIFSIGKSTLLDRIAQIDRPDLLVGVDTLHHFGKFYHRTGLEAFEGFFKTLYLNPFTHAVFDRSFIDIQITMLFEDPDTVDVEALQENRDIFLQWGYIFSDGTFVSSPAINIKVRDFDCIFDSTGTHITIKCIDGTNHLRFMPPHKPTEDTDDSMVKFLDSGCGLNVGVIIERFE
jgi:hypothetical protein